MSWLRGEDIRGSTTILRSAASVLSEMSGPEARAHEALTTGTGVPCQGVPFRSSPDSKA
jgi:hypothetical protein